MKKAFLSLLGMLLLSACNSYTWTDVTLPDGFLIRARVADTPQKLEKGLMFVKQLPKDEGMLFVLDKEQEHYFWMKNTLIDLDIIFLSANGQITTVHERVPHTYTYTPDHEVPFVSGQGQYVLEAAAGTAQRHGLEAGQKLRFGLKK